MTTDRANADEEAEGRELQTFIFEGQETGGQKKGNVRSAIYKYCATLFSLSFGIMLGWPSPAYPELVSSPDSPIPITWDQSAMIAGFLMLGNIVGSPLSAGQKPFGIALALLASLLGWTAVMLASNVYHLLAGRFLVGLGNGYANGQANEYLKTNPFWGKFVHLHTGFGVVVAVVVGGLFGYETLPYVAIVCVVPIAFVSCLVRGETSAAGEQSEKRRCTGVFKNAHLRAHFFTFLTLVFFQQFTGAPATVVYNQTIFKLSDCSYPVYYSMVYALAYFLSNVFAAFYGVAFNTKYALLMSSLSACVMLSFKVVVLYYNVNEEYWGSTSLVVLIMYIFFHSVGMGCAPLAFAQRVFPEECKRTVFMWYAMVSSAFALIITKVFQTLFTQYDLYVPFCLFAASSLLCGLFSAMFVSSDLKECRY